MADRKGPSPDEDHSYHNRRRLRSGLLLCPSIVLDLVIDGRRYAHLDMGVWRLDTSVLALCVELLRRALDLVAALLVDCGAFKINQSKSN
jgi:hypothetical protein